MTPKKTDVLLWEHDISIMEIYRPVSHCLPLIGIMLAESTSDEPAHEKRDLMVFRFGATDMRFFIWSFL